MLIHRAWCSVRQRGNPVKQCRVATRPILGKSNGTGRAGDSVRESQARRLIRQRWEQQRGSGLEYTLKKAAQITIIIDGGLGEQPGRLPGNVERVRFLPMPGFHVAIGKRQIGPVAVPGRRKLDPFPRISRIHTPTHQGS